MLKDKVAVIYGAGVVIGGAIAPTALARGGLAERQLGTFL